MCVVEFVVSNVSLLSQDESERVLPVLYADAGEVPDNLEASYPRLKPAFAPRGPVLNASGCVAGGSDV